MTLRLGGNRLRDLQRLGQGVWLDGVHHGQLAGDTLARLIRDDGVCGLSTNAASLASGVDEPAARALVGARYAAGDSLAQIAECVALNAAQRAAASLQQVYAHSRGRDGYASLDLDPDLADDAEGTEREGCRMWRAAGRANIMLKVPATAAGVRALRHLVAQGIPVNATLIFSAQRYRDVADAYLLGLEDRAARGQPLEHIASVASLFLGRLDARVDQRLAALAQTPGARNLAPLRGQAAIAVARLAYQSYKRVIASPRWQVLASQRAPTQRLLWASTESSDTRDSDVKYVNALIGQNTLNTLTLQTLEAYRDHGLAAPTLERGLLDAVSLLGDLQAQGVDLEALEPQLEREGLERLRASQGRRRRQIALATRGSALA